MKYIKKFEQNIENQNEIDFSSHKEEVEKVFDTNNWLIIKPKTLEALYYWSQDQGWSDIEYDVDRKYKHYDNSLGDIYININKINKDRIFFDFHRSHFYGRNEDDVYLKEFFDNNSELLLYYGEILSCSNIVKDDNNHWFVVESYVDFETYFKLDRNTRKDLIKKILSGESYEIFSYDTNAFNIKDSNIELNKENLILAKVILFIEKINNDYDYDILDVNDYDDLVEIIKEYDLDNFENLIQSSIRSATEFSDGDAAYEDVTNTIYDFFNLEMGSAKWKYYNNSKYEMLWIKFKDKIDAYKAKMIIKNYDSSYDDDVIKYSPPYYGYSGGYKDTMNYFNQEFDERLSDNFDNSDEIYMCYKFWKDEIEKNPNMNEEEMLEILDIFLSTKKYGI